MLYLTCSLIVGVLGPGSGTTPGAPPGTYLSPQNLISPSKHTAVKHTLKHVQYSRNELLPSVSSQHLSMVSVAGVNCTLAVNAGLQACVGEPLKPCRC